jgi:MFS family permease
MLRKPRSADGVFSHRDMSLVIPARALSYVGDAIAFVILLLKVAESGRPVEVTILLGAFSVPLFVMAPIAGRIVDEFDSRHVLVVAGSLQALASLGLAMSSSLVAMVVFLLALQTAQSITGPAWTAIVPRIVGPDLVGRAVGLQQSLAGVAGLAGAAIGGTLYDLVGYSATMLIDTSTFVVLAIAGALVQTRRGRRHELAVGRVDGTPALSSGAEPGAATGGLAVVRADSLLRTVIPALCLFVLSIEAINVVEVFLVRGDLGGTATDYGLISAAFMLGQVVGPMVAGRAADDAGRVVGTALAAAVIGVSVALIGVSPSLWLVYPLYAVAGVGGGALNGYLMTLVIARSSEAVRGRVIAVLVGATRGCSALAMVLGGVLGQLLGARTTFVICGALSGLVALMVLRARDAAGARISPVPISAATMEA